MLSQAIGDHEGRGNRLRNGEGRGNQDRPVIFDNLSSKHDIADDAEACEQDADDHQRPGGNVDERPMVVVGDLSVPIERHVVLLREHSEGSVNNKASILSDTPCVVHCALFVANMIPARPCSSLAIQTKLDCAVFETPAPAVCCGAFLWLRPRTNRPQPSQLERHEI